MRAVKPFLRIPVHNFPDVVLVGDDALARHPSRGCDAHRLWSCQCDERDLKPIKLSSMTPTAADWKARVV